jgi:hypothetical protein
MSQRDDNGGAIVDEGAADYVRRLRLRVGVSRSDTRMRAVQDPVGLAHAALDLADEADRLRAENEQLQGLASREGESVARLLAENNRLREALMFFAIDETAFRGGVGGLSLRVTARHAAKLRALVAPGDYQQPEEGQR